MKLTKKNLQELVREEIANLTEANEDSAAKSAIEDVIEDMENFTRAIQKFNLSDQKSDKELRAAKAEMWKVIKSLRKIAKDI